MAMLPSITQTKHSVEGAGRGGGENISTLLVGMLISVTPMESNIEVPQKSKIRTTIQSSDTTPRHISEGVNSRI
jgi:hypothetical protein